PASEPPTPEHVASIGDGLSCSGDDASGQSVCDLPALHGEPLLRAPPTFVFIGDEGTERTRVLGERNADDFASTVEAACDVSCEGSRGRSRAPTAPWGAVLRFVTACQRGGAIEHPIAAATTLPGLRVIP